MDDIGQAIIDKHRTDILRKWDDFRPKAKQSIAYPGWFADFVYRSDDIHERGVMWSGHGKTPEEAISSLQSKFNESVPPV